MGEELEAIYREAFGDLPNPLRACAGCIYERICGWWPCLRDPQIDEAYEKECDLRDVVEELPAFDDIYKVISDVVAESEDAEKVSSSQVAQIFGGDKNKAEIFMRRLDISGGLYTVPKSSEVEGGTLEVIGNVEKDFV